MRRILCLLVFLVSAWWASAQDEEILRAARYLSGASSDEEIDDYWTSRLESRQGRKIRINSPHPRADGILSEYQLASLADYRATCGDILSWEELALVDGFSAELVGVLKPFLSLESSRMPGSADTVRVRAYTLARGTLSGFGLKARAVGSWWRLGGAWRGSDGTFYAEGTWRGHRLLLGDFNIRFGQGLALWSGFSMESLSTIDAFIRRTPGVSPVWSYTSTTVHRGLAYEFTAGRWRGYAFASLGGLLKGTDTWMAGGHLDWLGRYGQVGLSASWDGSLLISADTRWNWKGADYVGEVSMRGGAFAGKAAVRFPAGPFKLAFQGRMIPSKFSCKKNGEYALAAGLDFKSGRWIPLAGRSGFGNSIPEHQASLTVDASLLPIPGTEGGRIQVRVYSVWQWQFASAWALDLRFTERYRNYERPRSDVRADIKFSIGPWSSVFRAEGVHCEQFGGLSYLEGGYKNDTISVYLRACGFWIDKWNDRVYCYEREAPGNFSVPAYYGRGGAVSLVGSWKHRFKWLTLKTHLRASWMARVGRVPTPGLSLQVQCDI